MEITVDNTWEQCHFTHQIYILGNWVLPIFRAIAHEIYPEPHPRSLESA